MIYIKYSELTGKYYLVPKKRGESKVDITSDIKEIVAFESKSRSVTTELEAARKENARLKNLLITAWDSGFMSGSLVEGNHTHKTKDQLCNEFINPTQPPQ